MSTKQYDEFYQKHTPWNKQIACSLVQGFISFSTGPLSVSTAWEPAGKLAGKKTQVPSKIYSMKIIFYWYDVMCQVGKSTSTQFLAKHQSRCCCKRIFLEMMSSKADYPHSVRSLTQAVKGLESKD